MIGCIRAPAPYGPAVGTEHAEGFAARSAGVRETAVARRSAREYGGREMIATSPSRGVPSEGGSDAATRWHPAGEGSASVPGLPLGSVARPGDGRASRGSWCARFAPDGTTRGLVRHRPRLRGHVVPG